jgi:hypothetical protein
MPQGKVLVIETRGMLRVEEKGHGARASAEANVTVAIAIAMDMAEGILEGRRGTAIGDERRVLVGRVRRPARHLTSDVMVEGWKSC